MSFSLYQSSIPTFVHEMNAFLAILDKAEAHAEDRVTTRSRFTELFVNMERA